MERGESYYGALTLGPSTAPGALTVPIVLTKHYQLSLPLLQR
jgi:hypothetical protein